MSLIPIGNSSSRDLWDPFNDLELWNPLVGNFPSLFSTHFPEFSRQIFPSLETQISWNETPRAHVFRAYLPGFTRDEVMVFIDDGMLQISTANGKFASRFKLPDNARTNQIEGFMENGMLIVTVGKEEARRPNNVRVVEITE
ncbi:hypothetical protein SLE2022_273700 [Rubroshorea leprosula]